jgi:hypothetical protein
MKVCLHAVGTATNKPLQLGTRSPVLGTNLGKNLCETLLSTENAKFWSYLGEVPPKQQLLHNHYRYKHLNGVVYFKARKGMDRTLPSAVYVSLTPMRGLWSADIQLCHINWIHTITVLNERWFIGVRWVSPRILPATPVFWVPSAPPGEYLYNTLEATNIPFLPLTFHLA